MKLVVAGFGSVGRGLISLILERSLWRELRVVAVIDSRGAAVEPAGFSGRGLEELLSLPRGGVSRASTGRPGWGLEEVLDHVDADVLVELTPSDYETGGPGLRHVRAALARGLHVVTANKGPLVVAGDELIREARARGLELRFRATVMGGTPLIPLVAAIRHSVLEVEGVLNASTNFLLSRVEEGASFSEALEEARGLGVLEADPRLDLEGVDPAAKLCILALVLGHRLKLEEVVREPLGPGVEGEVREAGARGLKVRYVAHLEARGRVRGEVRLRRMPPGDALAMAKGLENIVKVRTRENEVVLKGLGGGGRATAEGVLEDILAVYENLFKPRALTERA